MDEPWENGKLKCKQQWWTEKVRRQKLNSLCNNIEPVALCFQKASYSSTVSWKYLDRLLSAEDLRCGQTHQSLYRTTCIHLYEWHGICSTNKSWVREKFSTGLNVQLYTISIDQSRIDVVFDFMLEWNVQHQIK